jgi:hypothetical protein
MPRSCAQHRSGVRGACRMPGMNCVCSRSSNLTPVLGWQLQASQPVQRYFCLHSSTASGSCCDQQLRCLLLQHLALRGCEPASLTRPCSTTATCSAPPGPGRPSPDGPCAAPCHRTRSRAWPTCRGHQAPGTGHQELVGDCCTGAGGEPFAWLGSIVPGMARLLQSDAWVAVHV